MLETILLATVSLAAPPAASVAPSRADVKKKQAAVVAVLGEYDALLRWLGEVRYSEEEQAFARTLQASAGVPQLGMDSAISPLEGQPNEGGSTDVGDVSYRAYVPDGPPPLPKPE
ncbi:MAG: hypothetical protein ACM3PV_10225 [Betaproteobacteria bacterium]